MADQWLREFLAEFLGTFLLVTIGNAAVAQQVVSGTNNFLSINFGYGMAVIFGIYASAKVSGAHLNPAVTVAMAIRRKLHWKKIPHYIAAQYLGAFIAGAVVFLNYYDGISNLDNGNRSVSGPTATAGIFATYPKVYLSTWNAFLDQVLGTAMLLIGVCSITDSKSWGKSVDAFLPIIVGLLITVIGISFGTNCGYAINPARDFGPRLFTLIAGYGSEVFSAYNFFFWIPIIAPHIGAVLGALIYDGLVGWHFPKEDGRNLQALNGKNEGKIHLTAVRAVEGMQGSNASTTQTTTI